MSLTRSLLSDKEDLLPEYPGVDLLDIFKVRISLIKSSFKFVIEVSTILHFSISSVSSSESSNNEIVPGTRRFHSLVIQEFN